MYTLIHWTKVSYLAYTAHIMVVRGVQTAAGAKVAACMAQDYWANILATCHCCSDLLPLSSCFTDARWLLDTPTTAMLSQTSLYQLCIAFNGFSEVRSVGCSLLHLPVCCSCFMTLLRPKHLPNVKTRFNCPQLFLSIDFQFRDDSWIEIDVLGLRRAGWYTSLRKHCTPGLGSPRGHVQPLTCAFWTRSSWACQYHLKFCMSEPLSLSILQAMVVWRARVCWNLPSSAWEKDTSWRILSTLRIAHQSQPSSVYQN